ncbi:MAG: TonB-dependent receptor plug domain-containing protein [Syntrophales bacterium]|jgi:iron complex outermembrane receptor protein|nr:TonB-dependent receptor [Syntrophales bacterium]
MSGFRGRVFFPLLILVTVFWVHGVCAEETVKKQTEYKLGEIPVVGKRLKEPVTSPYAVPESSQIQTDVWTAEEIEDLHPATVWDLLEQVPGIEVTFQGRQHMDFSNMRGTGSYGVILDGVYVSQIDRILATLPVDVIESMTVVRDATALTLGPLTNFGSSTGSSNQGFVVIKTKRAAKLEGGLVTSYGTFDTEKGHLYQGAKIGNFDYRLAGTYTHTDGKNDGDRDEWYNGSRNKSLLFRGGYTTSAFSADILGYASRGMREFQRGEIRVPTKKSDGTFDWSKVGTLDNAKWKIDPMESEMIAVNMNKPWNDTQTTTLQYAYNKLHVRSVQASFVNTNVTKRDQDSYSHSASLRHIVNWRNNILKVGGQFLSYRSPDGLAPSMGRQVYERMYSLFAHDEYRMLNDRLTVDAGIRADRKYYVKGPGQGESMREWADPTYTFALGSSYKLSSIFTLTGRYAYSENSLASYQVSADGSSLPAEKRSRFEVGLLANVHPVFNPWITLYYYDTKDQKVTKSSSIDPATGDEIDYVVAENVVTRGYEAGVSGNIDLLGSWNYRFQYTYVTTNDDTVNDSMSHRLASASLGYKYKGAFANASYRYVSSRQRSSSPAGVFYYELGDYDRFDANLGYNFKVFSRDNKITLYGRNLGDKKYATRYVTGAYWDPGRQIGVELAVSFF